MEKLVPFGSNGAAVMMMNQNSVAAQLKQAGSSPIIV